MAEVIFIFLFLMGLSIYAYGFEKRSLMVQLIGMTLHAFGMMSYVTYIVGANI